MLDSHMKETDADREVRDAAYRVTAAELRSFIERVEQLESDKADVAQDIKDTYAEAKSRGYDCRAIKTIVKERRRDADDLAEETAILDLYREALSR